MLNYFTLDNFNVHSKTIIIRVDINSPIINGKVVYNQRIARTCKTIRELIKKGSKIIILAHQGRKGKSDCVSLTAHQKLIEHEIGKKIIFSKEIYSDLVEKKVKKLKSGDVMLCENLRFFDDEKIENIGEENQIQNLTKLADYYVFDAFSVSHRDQTSVSKINSCPIIAGRSMERELSHLDKLEHTKKPHVFVFGGAKPDDLIMLIKKAIEDNSVDKILLTGVIGELALRVKGVNLGAKEKFLEEHGYLENFDDFKELFQKHEKLFEIPLSVAIYNNKQRIEIDIETLKENEENQQLLDQFLIQDIGIKTINSYEKTLKKAGSIYFKGPAGNFEDKNFEKGSKELIRIIVQSKGFSFMGGGHSVTAAKMFNMLKKFDYVSLAGGALVHFLSGEKLPGFEALKQSYKEFSNVHYDFISVGSNTLDIKVDVPEKLSEVEIGEKIKVKENFKISNGGGGINVSIALSRLGANVAYLGKISSEFKDILDKTLKTNKIGLIESKETRRAIAKSILMQTKDQDRVIFTYRGQNDFLELEDFDVNSFNSNNYYFTALNKKSLATQIKLAKIIKKRNKNAQICYNPSMYLIKEEGKSLQKLIKFIDILIFNFDEAKELTGDRDMSSCLRSVYTMGPKLVVITDGVHGSYAYNGKEEVFQKAKVPKKVVDTTGAGDCFAATFFFFYAKKYGIKPALQYASWNASALITKNGTQNGLLTFKELAKTKRA